MSKPLVIDIMTFIKHSFEKGESIPIDQLLSWVDAKHRLIPNVDELNTAIKLIGGCQKTLNTEGVLISTLEKEESDFLSESDLSIAFKVYQNKFNNLK